MHEVLVCASWDSVINSNIIRRKTTGKNCRLVERYLNLCNLMRFSECWSIQTKMHYHGLSCNFTGPQLFHFP